MKKAQLFLFLFLLPIYLYAQETISLKGTVVSDDGTPVPHALIEIKNTETKAISDIDGHFSLTLKASQKHYTIKISSVGYVTSEKEISTDSKEQNLNFTLNSNLLQLQEMVVTANKREQTIQKIAGSISSINSQKIEALQVSNANEFGRITPSLIAYDDGGGLYTTFSSRGIITIDASPVIGIYVDGVPMFNTYSFPAYITDVQRIEVLKGPQGTLYGRNTIGGVINIISKKPTNRTSGFASVNYGNLNQYNLQAGINTPLIKDKLFARINVGATGRDGYIKNTYTNNSDLLGRKVNSGNLKLRYILNDHFYIDLNSGIENKTTNAYALIGSYGATYEDISSALKNKPYEISQNVDGQYTFNAFNNALKVNYDNSKFNFEAITAYQYTDGDFKHDDVDYTIYNLQSRDGYTKVSTLSEELRIHSNTKGKFQYTAGAYLYYVKNDFYYTVINGTDNAGGAANPYPYPYNLINDAITTQDGFSFFGQTSYEPIKGLKFTAGLRYELENSKIEISRSHTKDGLTWSDATIGLANQGYDKKTQFDAFSPKADISYQLAENSLIYVAYTKGYRPGGINQFSANEDKAIFTPEYSNNYEIGVKNNLFNNKLRLNVTGFYVTYKDQQLYTVLDLNTYDFGLSNIGNSEATGIDFESEFWLTKGLNVNINLTYQDTKFTDYKYTNYGGELVDNKENKQILSPDLAGTFGVSYEFNLTKKWKSKFNIDYQYQGDSFFDPENEGKIKAYGLLNARYSVENSKYQLAIWGKNIADETYLSYGYSVSGTGFFASYGLPRTYGVSFSIKF